MHNVFVTKTSQFLPGPPVGNGEMADYIGRLTPAAERLGRLTLRQNRIRSRHYAIRPDGSSDWTVAKLAAEAVRGLVTEADRKLSNAYTGIFRAFLKHRDAVKIVTFWGPNDANSWRSRGRPLLFDTDSKPKPAFDVVIQLATAPTAP